jgi:hypothetical protein
MASPVLRAMLNKPEWKDKPDALIPLKDTTPSVFLKVLE